MFISRDLLVGLRRCCSGGGPEIEPRRQRFKLCCSVRSGARVWRNLGEGKVARTQWSVVNGQ
jgi:hypothetical protein